MPLIRPILLNNLGLRVYLPAVRRSMSSNALETAKTRRRISNPALFICDLQEKFKPAIYEYDKVISTTKKMLKAARILNIPIFSTTQLREKLGNTDPALELDVPEGYKTICNIDKSTFGMWTADFASAVHAHFPDRKFTPVIVGIESHICVTQTCLDLLAGGHKAYVLADGVSSCNKEEVKIALDRLRAEGVIVTTSEGWLYECMGDAGIAEFRDVSRLVREWKDETRDALKSLCPAG